MYMMGLRNVKRQMDKLGTKVEPIPFEYNKKRFSCLFEINVVPYRLVMTTLGAHPQSFWFDIASGYLLIPRLSDEEMMQLIRYLELKPSSNHRFTIEHLMLAFDRQARVYVIEPNRSTHDSKDKKNSDDEKRYFCGWKNHKINHVTEENLDKTERYMGMKMREHCEENNISSCWCDVPRINN